MAGRVLELFEVGKTLGQGICELHEYELVIHRHNEEVLVYH